MISQSIEQINRVVKRKHDMEEGTKITFSLSDLRNFQMPSLRLWSSMSAIQTQLQRSASNRPRILLAKHLVQSFNQSTWVA
jgi:hypothetical protein